MKVIDPMGEMLPASWEGYTTQLVNAGQEDLVNALKDIIKKEAINMGQEANVFVGKDTRYDFTYCIFSFGILYPMTMHAYELRFVSLTETL